MVVAPASSVPSVVFTTRRDAPVSRVATLEIGFDRIEDFPRQFLRDALADRPAFDEGGSGDRFDRDIPPIAGIPSGRSSKRVGSRTGLAA